MKKLKKAVVTKFNGKQAYKKNCRLINNEYYEINVDCVQVNSRWYPIDSDKIVFDYEVEEYIRSNSPDVIKGRVMKGSKVIDGHFTSNEFKNVIGMEKYSKNATSSGNPTTESSLGLLKVLSEIDNEEVLKNFNHGFEALNGNNSRESRDAILSSILNQESFKTIFPDVTNPSIRYAYSRLILVDLISGKVNPYDFYGKEFIGLMMNFQSFAEYVFDEFEWHPDWENFDEYQEQVSGFLDDYCNEVITMFKEMDLFRFFEIVNPYYDALRAGPGRVGVLHNALSTFESKNIYYNGKMLSVSETIKIMRAFFKLNEDFRFSIVNTDTNRLMVRELEVDLNACREAFIAMHGESSSSTNKIVFIDEQTAIADGYTEYFGSDVFVKNKDSKTTVIKNGDYGKLEYNVGSGNSIERKIVESNKLYEISPGDISKRLAVLADKYSFGIEYETSIGYIPKRHLYTSGLVPLRDGSLDGGIEYTTIPMEGSRGLEMVLNQTDLLSKYCNINDKCSLHVHIGNVPKTKEFTVAFYMLFKQIQDELFETIPPYKKDVEWNTRRGKDYCKPLRSLNLFKNNILDGDNNYVQSELDLEFDKILSFLTEGLDMDQRKDILNLRHPREGSGKWNWKSRYYALNMINLFFSKSGTVEFRLHTPTINKYKVINWLMICIAIVKYAENNINKILLARDKIDLQEILTVYSEDKVVMNYLYQYIVHRKNSFDSFYTRSNQSDSYQDEIRLDKSFEFQIDKFPDLKIEKNIAKSEESISDLYSASIEELHRRFRTFTTETRTVQTVDPSNWGFMPDEPQPREVAQPEPRLASLDDFPI